MGFHPEWADGNRLARRGRQGIQPGEHFYSADVLPAGATFDPLIHGHWSRQLGNDPLQTLFVRG